MTGHPAGSGIRNPRGSHLTLARHNHRGSFAIVVLACVAIALVGLQGGRFSVLQLFLLAAAVAVLWRMLGSRRRPPAIARDHPAGRARGTFPKPCVTVRRLGEAGDNPLWSNRWTVD